MCKDNEISLYDCLVNDKLLEEANFLHSKQEDNLKQICFEEVTKCSKYDHLSYLCIECENSLSLSDNKCESDNTMTLVVV